MKKKLIFLVSMVIASTPTPILGITQLEQEEAKKTVSKLPAQINALDKRIGELKEESEAHPKEKNLLKQELLDCLSQRRSDLAADLYEAEELSKKPVSESNGALPTVPAAPQSTIPGYAPAIPASTPVIAPGGDRA